MYKKTSLSIPEHVAVIMDGNRRWAKAKGLSASFGHKAGAEVAKSFVENCFDLNIKYLTLFVFSSENWNRSTEEIAMLNEILKHYLKENFDETITKGVRVRFIGELDRFDSEVRELVDILEKKSSKNKKFHLNLALSYGGRADICHATRKISEQILENKISLDQIDESMISNNLMTSEAPDPDLLIRTSGESRISNFLIWQLAYTELYFSKKLWPDFTKEDLYDAISEYGKRNRRYGG